MTLLETAAPAQIATCALRLAKLDATGATPAGATNGYCTKQFSTLEIKKVEEAGQEVTSRDACGDLDVNWFGRPILKRYDLTLTVSRFEPELDALLLSSTLLTKALTTTRTPTDGVTTSGSPVVTSATAAFTAYDVGSAISGAGIPALATIVSVQSATQATISANATATATGVSITVTAAAISVGTEGKQMGVVPTDYGLSIETWSKNVQGGIVDPVFPWLKTVLPATLWTAGDGPTQQFGQQAVSYNGIAVENTGWGNGPWNDWMVVRTGDSAANLSSGRALSRHYTTLIPAVQAGFVPVPTQV